MNRYSGLGAGGKVSILFCMNEKPAEAQKKRSWFRFHASTTWLMIFLACALLWRNVSFRNYSNAVRLDKDFGIPLEGETHWTYGWPAVECYESRERKRPHPSRGTSLSRRDQYDREQIFYASGIAINLTFGLVLLTAAAFLSEFPIHGREAHKQ